MKCCNGLQGHSTSYQKRLLLNYLKHTVFHCCLRGINDLEIADNHTALESRLTKFISLTRKSIAFEIFYLDNLDETTLF